VNAVHLKKLSLQTQQFWLACHPLPVAERMIKPLILTLWNGILLENVIVSFQFLPDFSK
jgi:hypothetical protein